MTSQTFKLIDLVLFFGFAALLTGCPDNKDGSESDPGPASGGTSGSQAGSETGPDAPNEPTRPEAMPLLCALDEGKWCSPCPKGDAGPLCCAGESCTPWDDAGPACAGVVGWCDNYTKTDAGVVCHD